MERECSSCPICGASQKYASSGFVNKYSKCPVCMAKWRLFSHKGELRELSLHELPKDGSAIYTIADTKEPLFEVIGKRLSIQFWKELQLDREINWEFFRKKVDPASRAVVTRKGEKLLYSWIGTRNIRQIQDRRGNTVEVSMYENGCLTLSTHSLFWTNTNVSRKRGEFPKVTLEIPLEDIRAISGQTGDSSRTNELFEISIMDCKGEKVFELQDAFLEVLKPLVEHALRNRCGEIEAEKKRERLHIVLDFTFLKNVMAKGGLVVQVIKCPECGAPLDLPEVGSTTKCIHCNNTVTAQDVFDKLKDLIE